MGNKRGINAKGLLLRSCYVFGALFFVRLQKNVSRAFRLFIVALASASARAFSKKARALFLLRRFYCAEIGVFPVNFFRFQKFPKKLLCAQRFFSFFIVNSSVSRGLLSG
jgi:hypothetical protein